MSKLQAALAEARDKVREAAKDGYNAHHKFQYASHHERMRVAAEALSGSGLTVVPTGQEYLPLVGTDKNAACLLSCRFALVGHGETLDLGSRVLPVCPGAGRPIDKAALGAQSEILGYLYRDLLCIPTGDDPDVSGRDDTPPAQPAPAKQAPAVAAAPSKGLARHVAAWKAGKDLGAQCKATRDALMAGEVSPEEWAEATGWPVEVVGPYSAWLNSDPAVRPANRDRWLGYVKSVDRGIELWSALVAQGD